MSLRVLFVRFENSAMAFVFDNITKIMTPALLRHQPGTPG